MTRRFIDQTLTVQYKVVMLDGATMSQVFSEDSTASDYIRPDPNSQIYEVTQDALGLIDLDLDEGGLMANRLVRWIDISNATNTAGLLRINVVDAKNTARVIKSVATLVNNRYYSELPFLVPQGSYLQVDWAGVDDIQVRINITPDDPSVVCECGSAVPVPPGPAGASLIFSSTVFTEALPIDIPAGVMQRFDASALADNAMTLVFPPFPLVDEQVGIIEVGNSVVEVTVDGNGNDLNGPATGVAATQIVATTLQALTWQYDGTTWRLV